VKPRTYIKAGVFVKKELLPRTIPAISQDSKIEAIELKATGHVLWNGKPLDFVDMRVYVEPGPAPLRTPSLTDQYTDDGRGNCTKCGQTLQLHEPGTLRCVAS
jgi:hypothetical protein